MATPPSANPFDQFDAAPAANPFDQFDAPKAVPEQPSLLHTMMRKLLGLGDSVLGGISADTVGLTTPLAGVAARLTGHDPNAWKQAYDNAMVYHSQTPEGQAIDHSADSVLVPVQNAIGKGVNTVDQAVGKYAGPGVQTAVRDFTGAGLDLAGSLPIAGLGAQAVDRIGSSIAARAANSAVARAPDEVAQAAGFKVRPTDVKNATGVSSQPSLTSQLAEDAGGAKDTRIEFIRHNKANGSDIAAQDIGLPPKTPLTDENLAKAKKPFAAVYDKVEAIPAVSMDDQKFIDAAMAAGKRKDSVLHLPATVDKAIRDVLSKPTMTGKQMVDTISDLRDRGWRQFYSENADEHATGIAHLDLANALDDRLAAAANAVDPALGNQYLESRVGFSKIQTVKNARVGLDVDPQRLARAAAKTNAIDGGLKVIADTATAFPKVMTLKVPEPSEGMLKKIKNYGTLGTVPAVQKLSRMLLSSTRGEAAAPMLGEGGPLGYYYRDRPTDTRSPFPDRPPFAPDSGRLLPSPSDVSIDLPNQGLNAADRSVGSYGHPGEPAPFNNSRFPALPAPGQETQFGIPPVTPMGTESINLADTIRPFPNHPGTARAPILRLPAPGQTTVTDIARLLMEPSVGLNHPGAPNLKSTVTEAQRKARLEHLINVLSRTGG
jgi:hypothetical protein